MKEKQLNIKNIIPILLTFFVMSFCDLIGIGVDRAKNDFGLTNFLAQLIPSAVFFWFLVLSVPVGLLQNRFGKRRVLYIGVLITTLLIGNTKIKEPPKKKELTISFKEILQFAFCSIYSTCSFGYIFEYQ